MKLHIYTAGQAWIPILPKFTSAYAKAKVIQQGAFITIKVHSTNLRRSVNNYNNFFHPLNLNAQYLGQLVLDENSISSNREVNRKCGFLDLRLPKRSCKMARFGSGVLPNSLDNVAVQLVSGRALLHSNENQKEGVLPRGCQWLFSRPYSAVHRPLMHTLFAAQLNRSTIFRVE